MTEYFSQNPSEDSSLSVRSALVGDGSPVSMDVKNNTTRFLCLCFVDGKYPFPNDLELIRISFDELQIMQGFEALLQRSISHTKVFLMAFILPWIHPDGEWRGICSVLGQSSVLLEQFPGLLVGFVCLGQSVTALCLWWP